MVKFVKWACHLQSPTMMVPVVPSLTEIGLLELETKVESWISSWCVNQNVASNTQTSSALNLDDKAPLQDPTKRQRQVKGNKRNRGSLKDKLSKKTAPCKRKDMHIY